jgi:chromosome segregation protein
MKALHAVHIVQFSFWDYETFEAAEGGTAFIGPNGAGKTSLVDAIQIAMMGGHGQHLHFNAQSVQKDARSLCDYSLGTMRSGEGDKGVLTRKRDNALSYITLVFKGERESDYVSAGMCIAATAQDRSHRVLGLFVLPGVKLELADHLEDRGDEGQAPCDWGVFETECRAKAKAAGLTPTFTSKPETYVSELLHSIQRADQPIDTRRFLRALGHSINLKHVSSVGDFLRGYLVQATPIDKQGTLRHIKTLRRLNQQIDEVKEQLVRLGDFERRFGTVANLHRTRAAAVATKLRLQVESADEQVGKLSADIETLGESIAKAESALVTLQELEATRQEEYNKVLQDQVNDPERKSAEEAGELKKSYAQALKLAKNGPDDASLQVRSALLELSEALKERAAQVASGLWSLHDVWEANARKGHVPGLGEMQEALSVLTRVKATVADVVRSDGIAAAEASKRLDAVKGKQSAARSGFRIRDEEVGRALALFEQEGIECQPVASLVRVTDLNWQGAIESFLGRNRFALVVKAGREQDAVRLIRRKQIPEVTVVQPNHLRDVMHVSPEPKSVAALLKSDNAVALAFLWRILGKMRQVETEAELEEYSRALTADYMLSANGGTRRIRPIDQSEWVLGVQISSKDREDLRQELADAASTATAATARSSRSSAAQAMLTALLAGLTLEKYQLRLSEYETAKRNQESLGLVPASMSERLNSLQQQVAKAQTAWEEARNATTNKRIQKSEWHSEKKTKETDLQTWESRLKQMGEELDEATGDIDYDPEQAAAAYERALPMLSKGGLAEALAHLERERQGADTKLPGMAQLVMADFSGFIGEQSINLVEERSDWRKARRWVAGHVKRLTDSTLVEYKAQAEAAREAAEQAFRSDVKYRLREAIQKVEHEIRDLNRMLDTCPPFTGGEKYRFVADISSAHRPLYDLIVRQPDDGASESLFESNDVQDKLLSLMEASEKGEDKGNNPLEDYRLFYNFDLEIRVEGVKVDVLSKRMGVASNGEHRVPFYVIAGAALATAYRMKPGAGQGGGLMILDEAFYGMDAQNTFVTAEFLRSLGLQLVMAGPDSDIGKLLPVLDTYFDLTRFGPDVFVERVIVKEAARRLLQSDLPERNPQLVEDKVRQLALAAK